MTRLLRSPEVKAILRTLVGLMRLLAPTRSHVVVAGFPDTEGNAVEVVRRLATDGVETRWLTRSLDAADAARTLALDTLPTHVRVLPKASLAGFAAYLTARLTFFTHGLYLSPTPPARKPVVNLWHGDGPKAPLRDRRTTPPRATLLVSGTRLFGEIKAGFLNVPLDDLVVTGNPRCDQLVRPATDDELRLLGIDPGRPFVVAMPTFRSSIAVGSRVGWQDTTGGTATYSSTDMLAGLALGAAASDAQVVVKPHPLDAEEYASLGVVRVRNADLERSGVALYRLLGRAAALVTDYSSVWTDWLALDRPVGFVLHDIEDYSSGSRGLNVSDLGALLPGPELHTPDECASFVKAALADPAEGASQRAAVAERIGLARPVSATDALWVELSRRGVV